MKVQVNNKEMQLDAAITLHALIIQLGIAPVGIAVAVNNQLITRALWETTLLEEGNNIVIIKAACGG
jgi:sulfur carrier protein